MSHLLTHPEHHAHLHHVPLRPTIALALAVLVANVGLVWFALSLRSDPADDAAQIRSVVNQQIEALNDRDAEALQLTYCREQGPVADAILVALGPRTDDGILRVAQITDIQIIGSRLATAQVVVEADGSGVPGVDLRPESLTLFRKDQTGWKMCDPGNQQATTLHL